MTAHGMCCRFEIFESARHFQIEFESGRPIRIRIKSRSFAVAGPYHYRCQCLYKWIKQRLIVSVRMLRSEGEFLSEGLLPAATAVTPLPVCVTVWSSALEIHADNTSYDVTHAGAEYTVASCHCAGTVSASKQDYLYPAHKTTSECSEWSLSTPTTLLHNNVHMLGGVWWHHLANVDIMHLRMSVCMSACVVLAATA